MHAPLRVEIHILIACGELDCTLSLIPLRMLPHSINCQHIVFLYFVSNKKYFVQFYLIWMVKVVTSAFTIVQNSR